MRPASQRMIARSGLEPHLDVGRLPAVPRRWTVDQPHARQFPGREGSAGAAR
jgi:hypothetical protein